MAISALAMAPVIVFASAISLQHAYGAAGYMQAAAWIAAAGLPILFGLMAILAVSLAAEALILRWLLYLERVARAYSRGHYRVRPRRLLHAPREFQSLGVAVADMASAVEDRDAALRTALSEQTVLLREVHHRVNNNLQIIGSLLGLQATRSSDPGVKAALIEALVRIDAMALAQTFMKPTEAEDRVSMAALFTAFAAQARARMGGQRRLVLPLEADDTEIGLNQGARLVLAAAEGLLLAYRRASTDVFSCRLSVRVQGDTVVLTLTAPGLPDAFAPVDDIISAGLIDGYVRQLRGRMERGEGPDGELRILSPISTS